MAYHRQFHLSQAEVFADHLLPRIDAVLPAFGVVRERDVRVSYVYQPHRAHQTLVIEIDIHPREYVDG